MAKKKRISSNGANNASNGSGNRPGSTGGPSLRVDGTSPAADSLIAAKSVNTAANTRARPAAASSAAVSLPLEVERGDWSVVILALMMFLAPAVGVPNEYMLQDTLTDQRTRDRSLLNQSAIRSLINEHQLGRRDHSRQLWGLLTLELWLRAFIDERPERRAIQFRAQSRCRCGNQFGGLPDDY